MKTPVKPVQFIASLILVTVILISCKTKPVKQEITYTLHSLYTSEISHSDGVPFTRNLFKSNTNGTYSFTSLNTNNSLIRVHNQKDSTAHYNNNKLTGYTISKYTCKLDSVYEIGMNKNSGNHYTYATNGHYDYRILKISGNMDTVPYQINVAFNDTLDFNCPEKLKNDLLIHVINTESQNAFKKHIAEIIKNLPFKTPDYTARKH